MDEKSFDKYLIILGSLTVVVLAIVAIYGFLGVPDYRLKGLTTQPLIIQWDVLQLPQLDQLADFSSISYPSQTMGRETPLASESQENANPTQ